jgi:hypothetical protein
MDAEEHWEIAAIADALEDWASAPFRRARRRPTKRLRSQAVGIPLARCASCGALAEWHDAAAKDSMAFCDQCVPRGCTCRIIDCEQDIAGRLVLEERPNGQTFVWTAYDGPEPRQELDGFGRMLPCLEWDHYPGGFPRAPS